MAAVRELSDPIEAGAAFKVHPETLRRAARAGRVRYYLVGRGMRFDLDELREDFRVAPVQRERHTAASPDFDALDDGV